LLVERDQPPFNETYRGGFPTARPGAPRKIVILSSNQAFVVSSKLDEERSSEDPRKMSWECQDVELVLEIIDALAVNAGDHVPIVVAKENPLSVSDRCSDIPRPAPASRDV